MADPDEVINAIDPDWAREAKERMQARRAFTAINLVLSPDRMAAHTMAREMNYHVDMHPDNRAVFSPQP